MAGIKDKPARVAQRPDLLTKLNPILTDGFVSQRSKNMQFEALKRDLDLASQYNRIEAHRAFVLYELVKCTSSDSKYHLAAFQNVEVIANHLQNGHLLLGAVLGAQLSQLEGQKEREAAKAAPYFSEGLGQMAWQIYTQASNNLDPNSVHEAGLLRRAGDLFHSIYPPTQSQAYYPSQTLVQQTTNDPYAYQAHAYQAPSGSNVQPTEYLQSTLSVPTRDAIEEAIRSNDFKASGFKRLFLTFESFLDYPGARDSAIKGVADRKVIDREIRVIPKSFGWIFGNCNLASGFLERFLLPCRSLCHRRAVRATITFCDERCLHRKNEALAVL
jgi:hypothetical protein